MGNYYIYPAGTPSHTAALYARYLPGTFPSGKLVAWMKDGQVIKGPTLSDDASSLIINSGSVGDVSFWAGDTGATIEFTVDSAQKAVGASLTGGVATLVTDAPQAFSLADTVVVNVSVSNYNGSFPVTAIGIDALSGKPTVSYSLALADIGASAVTGTVSKGPGTATTSDPAILSNHRPALTAAVLTDAFLKSPQRPTFVWTYTDADSDPQFFYRVKIGSLPSSWELYDSGKVTAGAAGVRTLTMPDSYTALPYGSKFYWSIDVSDGEKLVPSTPDPTTDCWVETVTGTGFVTVQPTVGYIQVNGSDLGTGQTLLEVPLTETKDGFGNVTGREFKPTISWNYSDIDGQPQAAYRIVVAGNLAVIEGMQGDSPIADPSTVYWDSGQVGGSEKSAIYGSVGRRTSKPLPSYVSLFVGVSTSDGISWSPFQSYE